MGGVHKNAGIYRLKDAFRLAMYQVHPLNDCVTRITIKNTNSQMFLCSPWENILRWANRVGDRYLPYGDAEHKGGSPIGSRVKRLAQLELALAPIRTGYYLTQAPQVRQLRSPPASPGIGKKERGILD